MPSKKKKYNARFPAGRIKKIMQTDEEVGKVAQAVPVIISRTLELFVESLLTKSLEVTLTRNAKTLSPSHVKLCISAESRFDFLKDLVKNIPDISQAEEKELSQIQSAESSPNAYRFQDVPPGPSVISHVRPALVQHLHGRNGRTGDVGTEYEFPGKCSSNPNRLPKAYNNGRNAPQHTAVVPDAIIDLADDDRVSGLETRNAIGDIPGVAVSVQNTSLRECRPSRLPNFYTETLNTGEDDDSVRVGNPPSYGSVIRPNPDYSPQSEPLAFHKRSDSYDKNMITNMANSSETRPPEHRLDLSKSFLRNASVDSAVDPVFHLNLSAVLPSPLTPSENRATDDSPYTPSSAWQPRTPRVESKFFPESLKRSDSCPRRGPPPLLKRSASEGVKVPNAIQMPPLANIAPLAIHLDLSRSNFEKVEIPSPSSCSVSKKKKGNFSNEPPPLLPITTTQKTASVILQKNKSVEMQLDEDYDT